MTKRSELIKKTRRCVVKIGSALLTHNTNQLDLEALSAWIAQIAKLKRQGIEVVLVSSGSVAVGMGLMGWVDRPKSLHKLQAAAAIGQAGLIEAYQNNFKKYQLQTAQILLTHDDIANRKRYLNARSTLRTLLTLNTIPIINENDTVAMEEIRLGDNDTLAALVANLIDADLLIILTDQSGLYDKDPRESDQAELIALDSATNPNLLAFAGGAGTTVGTGGMRTKVLAAQAAARSNCSTLICSGSVSNVLARIFAGDELGTLLTAEGKRIKTRKQWISSQANVNGQLELDEGAVIAMKEQGRSLLAVGIVAVQGDFRRGDVVDCIDSEGKVIARGLSNYSATECLQIKGLVSQKIAEKIGYIDESEVIHRDNLTLL
ncbi:MAG: glutamate 5-kinase [Thiotrichaceae bacterium]|nr:glutamate 5-kinase [Thiotrichaceae bacterium]